MIILKILGCVIIIYALAIFLASLKKLLPFLAILGSIATIFLVWYIIEFKRFDLSYLYAIFLVFVSFCYLGESFFSTRVVNNTYMVVGIERKWRSLFEDFDEYKIHISPVEAGGFFSNLLSNGLIFGLLAFAFFPGFPRLAYMVPVYYLLLSVLDLICLFIVQITGIFRWFLHGLVIIATLASPTYIKEIMDKIVYNEKGVSYFMCKNYSDLNFKNSYYFEHSKTKIGEEEKVIKFIYNDEIDVAGYFDDYDNESPLFNEIIYKDYRFNDTISFYRNLDEENINFKYGGIVEPIKSEFKYKVVDNTYDFKEFMKLNKDKFDASQVVFEEDIVSLKYETKFEKGIYKVNYVYNLNENDKVSSLNHIECNIIDDQYIYKYIYKYIENEKYLKDYFIDVEGNLSIISYVLNSDDIRSNLEKTSNIINENVDDNVASEIKEKMIFILDVFAENSEIILNYDFVMDYSYDSYYDDSSCCFIYDSETYSMAVYNNDLFKGIKASIYKDFEKYKPQAYFYLDQGVGYDLANNETIYNIDENFPEYMFGLFDYLYSLSYNDLEYYYLDNYLVASCYDSTYDFYFKNTNEGYVLEKVDVDMFRNRIKYRCILYLENQFNINQRYI